MRGEMCREMCTSHSRPLHSWGSESAVLTSILQGRHSYLLL